MSKKTKSDPSPRTSASRIALLGFIGMLSTSGLGCAFQIPEPPETSWRRETPTAAPYPSNTYDYLSGVADQAAEWSKNSPNRRALVDTTYRCEQQLHRLAGVMRSSRNARTGLSVASGGIGGAGAFVASVLSISKSADSSTDTDTAKDVAIGVGAGVALVGVVVAVITPALAEPATKLEDFTEARATYRRATNVIRSSPAGERAVLEAIGLMEQCADGKAPVPAAPPPAGEVPGSSSGGPPVAPQAPTNQPIAPGRLDSTPAAAPPPEPAKAQ